MTAAPRVARIRPPYVIAGGRVTLEGSGFEVAGPRLPDVTIGGVRARVACASPTELALTVPTVAEGGSLPVRIDGAGDHARSVDVAGPFATGLHQVDNPVFDREANLYVTYSGTRGQQVPVSIFRVRPNGTRETFSSGIVNPTSMAIDPDGRLYVSSRFEGTVYRIGPEGEHEPFANDLGVACGLAFDVDGTLYVGDGSGTIFRVDPTGHASSLATLPASVAAFHLAIGPDRTLFVTGPTLAPYDVIYRIDRDGTVAAEPVRFGRPQGLAFGPDGSLYVVEALAGASGVYRVTPDGPPELVLSGPGLVGVAFGPDGSLVVCSNETAYRIARFQR